jgi:hypothetical protein
VLETGLAIGRAACRCLTSTQVGPFVSRASSFEAVTPAEFDRHCPNDRMVAGLSYVRCKFISFAEAVSSPSYRGGDLDKSGLTP